jgi:hypothetical protein
MLMSKQNQVARLHYMAAGYRILSNGDHVICAISEEQIGLEELRYWSAARQEAYSSCENAARALLPKG